jgi:tetratricopeptide (TPR) repeat protein
MQLYFRRIIGLSLGVLAIASSAQASSLSSDKQLTSQVNRTDLSSQSRIELQRGQTLYVLGRYSEALLASDKALETYGDRFEVWELRGNVLHQLERYQEALEAYDQALTLLQGQGTAAVKQEDTIATLWAERARVLTQLNRYEESISSYDRSLQVRCAQQQAASLPLPEVCQTNFQIEALPPAARQPISTPPASPIAEPSVRESSPEMLW